MQSNTRRFGQAVIIGGSIGGLMSARVLAEHFDQVIVLERESAPTGPEPRKNAPQGRHIHALLEAGLKVMEGLFPGLMAEMEHAGADVIDMARDAAWLQAGSWKARYEGDIQTLLVSRPFLEWKMRGRVAALPNVRLRSSVTVEELLLDDTRSRVSGVRVQGPEGEERLQADLVVDAGGRGSHAPRWLRELGFGEVAEDEVRINLGYTSRMYERPANFDAWKILSISGTAPEHHRAAYISNVEGNRWIVSLIGYFGDHPPTDHEGFLEFARKLPVPDVHEYLRHARPLSEPVLYKIPTNRWLHYERMRLPGGFMLLGDSVCALNPVFGQGMTTCALGAQWLGESVAEARRSAQGLDTGVSRRFQQRLAKLLEQCWSLTSTMDLMHPRAEGKRPPGLKALQRTFMNMIDLTSRDAAACQIFYESLHQRTGITGLLQPRFLGALVAYSVKSLFVPRAERANVGQMPPHPRPTPPHRPSGRMNSAA